MRLNRRPVGLAVDRRRCLVGLIGVGIGFSLTPAMHELEGDALGLRYLYQTIDLGTLGIDPEDSGALVLHARQLGFAGLNVTHPCKRIIAREVDELSPDAELIGSVNTVVFTGNVSSATTPTEPRLPKASSAVFRQLALAG